LDIHLKDILEPVIVAVFLFFGWLMKRSLYGEMEELKKEMETIKNNCVFSNSCADKRNGCNQLMIEKFDHLSDMLKVIQDRQILLINRFDGHINGYGYGEKK